MITIAELFAISFLVLVLPDSERLRAKCYILWGFNHFMKGLFFYLSVDFVKFCLHGFRNCFGPDSGFLRQLFFFFNARNADDIAVLVETCRLLQHFVQDSGNVDQHYLLNILLWIFFLVHMFYAVKV